jgi:hypothetical protein
VTTASTATLVPTLGTAGAAIGAARSYADSIAPGTIERDRAGRVPRAELAAFDRSGLLAVTVPATAGGPDLPISVLADPRDADAAARGPIAVARGQGVWQRGGRRGGKRTVCPERRECRRREVRPQPSLA